MYLKRDFTLCAEHPIVAQNKIEYEIILLEMFQRCPHLCENFFLLKICIGWPLWSLCQWKQKSGETLKNVKNSLFHH